MCSVEAISHTVSEYINVAHIIAILNIRKKKYFTMLFRPVLTQQVHPVFC